MDNIEKKLDALFELGKYREVLELAYETLYSSKSEKELLYQYIILSHMNLEEYHKALEMCEEALGEYPSTSAYIYLRSKNFYYISSYKKAISDIEEALEISPNEPQYLAHFAKVLLMENNYIQAKEMIERALELDSSVSEYHLTLAVVLSMLDGEKVAREIVDEVLAKEPHNLQALDIKQKYFTSKLKEKKSLLQNLLFLDPFDKKSQKDIKFIKYYYMFLPPLMAFVLFLTYLLQSQRREFGFLEPFVFVGFAVLGTLGSKDWRLNVPFIATLVSYDAYFNVGRHGISFGEVFYIVFQAVLFQFVFMGAYVFFRGLRHKFETRLEQQQNNKKNPILYFLFIASFEKYEVIEQEVMRRYYITVPTLALTSLLLIYVNMYQYEHLYLKVFVVLLFIYTGIRAYRVFWILVLYIFGVIFVTNGFVCEGCFLTLMLSVIAATVFVIPYKITRRFSWMRD